MEVMRDPGESKFESWHGGAKGSGILNGCMVKHWPDVAITGLGPTHSI